MPNITEQFMNEVRASGALGNRTDQRQKLNRIAESYLMNMKAAYSLYTVKNYLVIMRKFVSSETKAGVNHPAMQVLKLDSKDYHAMNQAYKETVTARSKNPFSDVDMEGFIETCESLIEGYNVNHISVVKLALGLAGLTGRRVYSEVLGFGKIGMIKGDDDHVIFAGQAKVKGDRIKPAFKIPVLSDADFMVDAWGLLRREKPAIPNELSGYSIPLKDLKSLTINAEKIGFEKYQALFMKHREDLKRLSRWSAHRAHTSAAETAKKIFADYGLKKPHDLRSIYAECCFKMFQPDGDRNNYFSEILGHNEGDLMTAQSYKGFRNN